MSIRLFAQLEFDGSNMSQKSYRVQFRQEPQAGQYLCFHINFTSSRILKRVYLHVK